MNLFENRISLQEYTYVATHNVTRNAVFFFLRAGGAINLRKFFTLRFEECLTVEETADCRSGTYKNPTLSQAYE